MNEFFRYSGIKPESMKENGSSIVEKLSIRRTELWHSMGIELATLFAQEQSFSFVSDNDCWYVSFCGTFGEAWAVASVVEPRYSADTLSHLSHHLRVSFGIERLDLILRETVINAMQNRKIAKELQLPDAFNDPRLLRVHMAQKKQSLVFSGADLEDGSTVERIIDRKTLQEAIELSELGEEEKSIFRCVRPDFSQVESIGFFLMRDKAGKPISTVTVVGNQNIAGVWNVATHPDQRRKGHGSRLLGVALHQPDFRNVTIVHLLSMPEAVGFYQKNGFVPTERAIYNG